MADLPTVFIIAGPTGIGKTDVSIPVAQALDAEIISADSRQIYRQMDIATAKPSPEETKAIPHHFIDIVDPDETYNAGRFGEESREVILAIRKRGKNILVVGGSGLYIRSMIDGFFAGAETDLSIREGIRREISDIGLLQVYETLKAVDSQSAERIHPNDAKRIERALEVYRITGIPISELYRSQSREPWCHPVFAGLRMDRGTLYQRIEHRVDKMIQRGVIEETRTLLEKGYSANLVSMEGLGYREIAQFLRNEIHYQRMMDLFKQHSRNYAKRQMTWFGKDNRIRWFESGPETTKKALAETIISYFTSAS